MYTYVYIEAFAQVRTGYGKCSNRSLLLYARNLGCEKNVVIWEGARKQYNLNAWEIIKRKLFPLNTMEFRLAHFTVSNITRVYCYLFADYSEPFSSVRGR